MTLVVLLLALPAAAFANVGTPLMWVGALHLFFGNALIGVFEGWIGARFFKLHATRSLLCMVVANYVSMAVGMWLVGKAAGRYLETAGDPLRSLHSLVWLAPLIAFVATLVLEWPFCWLATGTLRSGKSRATQFCVIANVASYAILLPFYYSASFGGLAALQVKTPSETAGTHGGWVYYIAPDGVQVHRIRLDGTSPELVLKQEAKQNDQRLFAEATTTGQLDLCIGWTVEHDRFTSKTLLAAFANNTTATAAGGYGQGLGTVDRGHWFAFGEATDLRPGHLEWKARTGFWPAEGVSVTSIGNDAAERQHIAIETPFVAWAARCASVIPGDIVVSEFDGRIVLLRPQDRTAAFLVRGSSPVVSLD